MERNKEEHRDSELDNMKRIPEPVVMDDRIQAIAYARADFSEPNQWFVDHLVTDYSPYLKRVLDIGTGPADIPIRLAEAKPSAKITAVDGSQEMVKLARKSIRVAGFEDRIKVVGGLIPGITLEGDHFDALISNSVLHHTEDPISFWNEMKRLAKGETVVYFMDLFRPETEEEARDIVESVSGNDPPVLKRDFYNSLLASFTVEEVRADLAQVGLEIEVDKVSDRHLLAKGLLKDIG